jgi:hypothetical protein
MHIIAIALSCIIFSSDHLTIKFKCFENNYFENFIDKGRKDSSCTSLLYAFVKSSSYNPDVRKLKFKAWVDTFNNSMAILKITLKNTERNEDMVIGWLKLDVMNEKLFDITIDPDKPVELKCDVLLIRKIKNTCVLLNPG